MTNAEIIAKIDEAIETLDDAELEADEACTLASELLNDLRDQIDA